MSNNKIELNPNMQYVLCGDISASMTTLDPKCGGLSRYAYMLEKFKQFIKEAEDFDPDGPTIILFGEKIVIHPNTTLANIDNIISNPTFEGFTNTDLAIKAAWTQHKLEREKLSQTGQSHPGTTVFIFTDGQPTNQLAVERIIVEIANIVDREDEFNIGFILVGTIDNNLKQYLDKLDDGLSGKCKYDIVGVTEIEGLTFLKAVNNAVNE